ncbi:MAG: ribosome maturation factor RimM [Sulfurovaceae bacterium]|nr:ribosome maturation factor RimM [Sulfurovaceae bacterium]
MPKFFIAQIGRTVGLMGDLKLHLHTDFPEQFKAGSKFESDRGELEVISYNQSREIIRFRGYESMESAKKLTNAKIYASEEQTKEICSLKDGEYFWFDIIECKVIENGEVLGIVKDIERLAVNDFLEIDTTPELIKAGMPKNFLVPYIPRYIINVDVNNKEIQVFDAKSILETS